MGMTIILVILPLPGIPIQFQSMTPPPPAIRGLPHSLQRIRAAATQGGRFLIGPADASPQSKEEKRQYELAHTIIRHLAIEAPHRHKSGHPGRPLSAFTFAYHIYKTRNPHRDQPLRMSAGHLSILAYGLQWLFGRNGADERLASPHAIIAAFRTADGLPGHIEAGIGDIPFGFGPLGKGVSNALGAALGLKLQGKPGITDVLMGDGDSQEGQITEAFRLASRLRIDNLVVHGDFNDMQLSGIPSETVAPDFAAIAAACGWEVIEVQDGNDPAQVRAALAKADALLGKGKPVFVCYYTTMGHGVTLMERGSDTGRKNFHGTPLSDEETAEALLELQPLDEAIREYEPFRSAEEKRYGSAEPVRTDLPLTFDPGRSAYKRTIATAKGAARTDFGAVHLRNLMAADDRIVVLHADLAGSGGFDTTAKDFPHRVLNVGIAEANMVMMAAGLRQTGLLPVTYTFAAFGTNEARANARLIDINCGHTRCGVLQDCTHAGLSVGEDGETHQERHYLDIPFDRTQVWMPGDSNQAGAMAERAISIVAEGHQSVFFFTARSGHDQLKSPDGSIIYGTQYAFDGRADLIRGRGDQSDRVTILATGIAVHDAVHAADALPEMRVRVLNVACIRPLDASAVLQAAFETGHLIVVEDHASESGLAHQVADVLADFAIPCTLRRMGVNRSFPSAPSDDLKLMAGLDAASIADAVQDEVRREIRGGEDAFITAMHELVANARASRFHVSCRDFVTKLLSEKGYFGALREAWAKRACPKGKLPKNEELLEELRELL